MAPHFLLDDHGQNSSPDIVHSSAPQQNGSVRSNPQGESLLQACGDDEVHDLVCVGFGPASLAIAVALHDALENGGPTMPSHKPKVCFLERQSRFAWHAGMLLPGTKMQITFIKDLATLRNPRSEFTFLNYLHRQGRLVSFTNLGTFLPQRIEYEDYMRWCANHFSDVVDYDQAVEAVDVGQTNEKTGAVEYFAVKSWNRSTGERLVRRAKHVVIAVGGKPNIPKCLRADHPRVIHSSQFATSISNIFPDGTRPRSVAVVGAGQSAAEIFHSIPFRFPGAKAYLVVRGAALRPSDDSPFVNEIFDPERVDDVYYQNPKTREDGLRLDRGTNYGVVRLELLDEIYSALYSYRIQYESEEEWPQRILTHRTVNGMSDGAVGSESVVRLHVQNGLGISEADKEPKDETLDVDLVVVASGYQRDAHKQMLQGVSHLLPGHSDNADEIEVGRDYGVKFRKGAVQSDAGIWLQGCNESTHGLSDTLLSILATRGGEMVESIFGSSSMAMSSGNPGLQKAGHAF
ncbi:hypothetical protein LTR37_019050 [Vermiconidia calcicola]|uniref:Uncharacterized protein n=1 Tax=Vermiconidia calcicola TaxID=1690605 RepID=A0ACC3MFC0_9PEZI|nr:hypothetical protein LTR37_019050 [Vermiconidia calcicola]